MRFMLCSSRLGLPDHNTRKVKHPSRTHTVYQGSVHDTSLYSTNYLIKHPWIFMNLWWTPSRVPGSSCIQSTLYSWLYIYQLSAHSAAWCMQGLHTSLCKALPLYLHITWWCGEGGHSPTKLTDWEGKGCMLSQSPRTPECSPTWWST